MIGCATSSPPLTPVAASQRKNSPFLGGSAAVPFPSHHAPPTLHLPPRRIASGVRAAQDSAAAERERESEYTSAGGGYSSSYTSAGGGYSSSYTSAGGYSSSSYSHNSPNPMSAFAAAASPSLYDVLGLSSRATVPEIKAAYRRLARSCHPDAASKGNASGSAEQFMRVHAAYSTLSDPAKRADYDRGLAMSVSNNAGRRAVYQRTTSYPAAGGASTASSTYSRSTGFQSGLGGRRWETDQCW